MIDPEPEDAVVDLSDETDALVDRLSTLADRLDPVPESVVESARAAFTARDAPRESENPIPGDPAGDDAEEAEEDAALVVEAVDEEV